MPAWSRLRYAAALVLGLGAAYLIAAQGKPTAPLSSNVTVSDGLPDGLKISVFSASYQATSAHATVLVGTEVQGLAEPETGARASGPRQLDVRYSVSGGPAAVPERAITVPLHDDATRRLASTEGVRVLTELMLAPGRYRVRVTVSDTGSQRAGSVVHDVDVPELTGDSPIYMSDLVVTSSAVGGLTHGQVDGDHRALPILGQPPIAQREFAYNEQLEVHAEFYEKPTDFGLEQDIFVNTRVWSANGDLRWDTRDSGTSEAMSGGRLGYAHSTLIPVSAFPPGVYNIEIEAETLYGVTTFVSRTMPVAIVKAR